MTGVVDSEDRRPRHMARSAPEPRPAAGGAAPVDGGHDGDRATAATLPTTRRRPWPASRRVRALARRRGR
ncbi:MAG: hypothetical protein ACRD07_13690, partial [Acidimicrobiales bacterium]